MVFTFGYSTASWRYGEKLEALKGKIEKNRAEAEKQARELEAKYQESADNLAREFAQGEKQVETIDRVITREVIQYVQAPESGHCQLSPDWVSIHNAAASGNLPEGSESTPSPVN